MSPTEQRILRKLPAVETLLQAHPEVNVVYAHNDEMTIGAIQALADYQGKQGAEAATAGEEA